MTPVVVTLLSSTKFPPSTEMETSPVAVTPDKVVFDPLKDPVNEPTRVLGPTRMESGESGKMYPSLLVRFMDPTFAAKMPKLFRLSFKVTCELGAFILRDLVSMGWV